MAKSLVTAVRIFSCTRFIQLVELSVVILTFFWSSLIVLHHLRDKDQQAEICYSKFFSEFHTFPTRQIRVANWLHFESRTRSKPEMSRPKQTRAQHLFLMTDSGQKEKLLSESWYAGLRRIGGRAK